MSGREEALRRGSVWGLGVSMCIVGVGMSTEEGASCVAIGLDDKGKSVSLLVMARGERDM